MWCQLLVCETLPLRGKTPYLSRPTTLKFLRLMRDVRPPPVFEVGRHVSLYVADQTYQWVGMKKRGRRQSLERHDAHGMPMAITHEVYVNSVKLLLPSSLATLSDAAVARIQSNHGSPYTEDYHLVLDPLPGKDLAGEQPSQSSSDPETHP